MKVFEPAEIKASLLGAQACEISDNKRLNRYHGSETESYTNGSMETGGIVSFLLTLSWE